MKITRSMFGKTPSGEQVYKYSLSNGNISADIITYGGTITSINVPDKNGRPTDIALGFASMEEYFSKDNPHFGCITGRFAGRINKGEFTIDGCQYKVTVNKPNEVHLHGGIMGLDKYVWDAEETAGKDYVGLKLKHVSPDGHEGFPGRLAISVEYQLKSDSSLHIVYNASTDKPTPVVLTNHNYFNLNGEASAISANNNILQMDADKFLVLDFRAIPSGEKRDVSGTPMDFRKPTPIGLRINDDFEQTRFFGGYDHPWILNNPSTARPSITASSPVTGIKLEVSTDQPAVVFYTGNGLKSSLKGKQGNMYGKQYGFCLETQGLPDSVNHADFPDVIITPSKPYRQTTIWKFSLT